MKQYPALVADGTTPLFVLLVAAVTATCSTVFYVLDVALPNRDQTTAETILLGLGAVFGLAAVIYWRFPSWIRRRHGLREITAQNSPELHADLSELCDKLGVRPTFLLAPKAQSTRGRAFGHARKGFVKVDAGLAVLSVTEPPVFRAVVLHELAHLRNRDVDKTYLTMAIWWAFVIIAVPLMGLLAVFPRIFVGSLQFDLLITLRTSLSLLAVTLLVYLVRNAFLRTREIQADAQAATWESEALRGLLEGTGGAQNPSLLSRLWDDHPTPQARADAIDHPERSSRPGLWIPFAVGLVSAVLLENGFVLLAMLLPEHLNLANFLTCLGISVGATTTIVPLVWRGLTSRPDARVPTHVFLIPLLLTVGFIVGEAISLINLAAGRWVMFSQFGRDDSATLGTVLVTVAPLLIGALLLTVWAYSAVRALATVQQRPRGALAALGAAATVAATPWMNLWLTMRSDVSERSPLETSASILLWPTQFLYFVGSIAVPGTVAGIILLAVVPVLIAQVGGQLRAALIGFTVGILAVVVVAVVPADGDAVIVAFEAVAAGATVLAARRQRPILALLALLVCGTVASFIGWLISDPRVALFELWHYAIVYGIIAAFSVGIVSAVGKAAVMKLRGQGSPAIESRPAPVRTATLFGAASLVLILFSLSNYKMWFIIDPTENRAASCVVGEWTETSYEHQWAMSDTVTVTLTRTGVTHRFNADGTMMLDYGTNTVEGGVRNGHAVAFVHNGNLRSKYRVPPSVKIW